MPSLKKEPESIPAEKRKTRLFVQQEIPKPIHPFRLLTIHAGLPNDPVRCSITAYDFGVSVQYDALSYCWEQRPRHALYTEPSQIIVELKRPGEESFAFVCVNWNLGMALTHMRKPSEDVTIWVDVFCMKMQPQDETERLDKIENMVRMKEIFSNARQVVLWLGEEAENAGLVFKRSDIMANGLKSVTAPITTRRDQRRISMANPVSDSERGALEKIMQRQCWERLWILSELTLAQKISLQCGQLSTSWEGFVLLCDAVDPLSADFSVELIEADAISSEPVQTSIRSRIRPMQLLRHQYERPRTFGHFRLLRLVQKFRDWKCSVPVDRVYALLMLANDRDREMNPPVDGLSREEIYSRLVKSYAKTYKRLDFLNYHKGEVAQQPRLWPSWMPYFNAECTVPSLIDFSRDISKWLRDDEQLFCAAGDRPARIIDFPQYPTRLGLMGVRVDIVRSAAEVPWSTSWSIDDIRGQLPQEFVRGTSMFYQHYEPGAYGTREAFDEAVRRTSIADMTSQRDNPNKRHSYAARRALRKELTSVALPHETHGTFWDMAHAHPDSVYRAHHRRRPFVTDRKYIGVGPQAADRGDVLCVLHGGQTPYLIREVGHGLWTIIGECYVHGFMDGESFLMNMENMTETFIFI